MTPNIFITFLTIIFLVLIINFLYLHCNNNHLKLIDMKLFTCTVFVIEKSSQEVFFPLVLTVTSHSIEGAKVALKCQFECLNRVVDHNTYDFDPDFDRIVISETIKF